MEKAGQKVLYLRKLPPTKFYLESNWKFLNERDRPEIPISPQTLSNEIRFRIKLKLSELKKADQKFLYLGKPSSAEFDLESNWNFLNGKAGQKVLYTHSTPCPKLQLLKFLPFEAATITTWEMSKILACLEEWLWNLKLSINLKIWNVYYQISL